ncbi:MAG: stage II sporulation protein M [Chitinophagaceae bacterium]|nr:stage II sporulation protein M [Chitinophagaceae bacterium]
MREARFIKKNVDKWNRYQHAETHDPDEMADRFVTLLDDLSYAKTFYPKSKVTRWINGIAAGIYQNIYQNKKEKYSRISLFWRYELPLLFRRYHTILLFTFLLFISFVLVAVISCLSDPNYAADYFNNMVQPGYYDATISRIQKGDPFGIYKDANPFSMFVHIAYNNIGVAFKSVISGVFFGIGTIFLMWRNGLMLGCFQYIFFSQGVGWQSVLVIWIHGTLEISAIVIASCAGFILGTGFLFPGTYTRKQSFLRAAKDAMKICISLVPVFIVAAFFESYVTHLMSNAFDKDSTNIGLPVPAGVLILATSLAFILWYFVIYPIRLHRQGIAIKHGKIIRRNEV